MDTLQQLADKKANLAANYRQHIDDKWDHEKAEWASAEDEATGTRMDDELNELDSKIEKERNRATMAARRAALEPNAGNDGSSLSGTMQRGQQPQDRPSFGNIIQAWCRKDNEFLARAGVSLVKERGSVGALDVKMGDTRQVRQITRKWKSLPKHRKDEIYNAPLTTGTDATGGHVVAPEEMVMNLEANLLAFGGIRPLAQTLVTEHGNQFTWPSFDDTANSSSIVAESNDIDNSGAGGALPTFRETLLNAYKYNTGVLLVPWELIEDSPFDIPMILGQMLGERHARGFEAHLATGTGSGQPQGAVTGSVLGVTAASATTVTADELMDLEGTLDPSRESNSRFMFRKTTKTIVRKLKDANGQYLWGTGLNGEPDTLLGYPVTINQQIPAATTGLKSILLGDFSYMKIRRVRSMRLFQLVELYAAKDQIGIGALIREDAALHDPSGGGASCPIKHLIQA